jgi:hypothetical protein
MASNRISNYCRYRKATRLLRYGSLLVTKEEERISRMIRATIDWNMKHLSGLCNDEGLQKSTKDNSSGPSREWLCGQEEANQQGIMSCLMLFPLGRQFSSSWLVKWRLGGMFHRIMISRLLWEILVKVTVAVELVKHVMLGCMKICQMQHF